MNKNDIKEERNNKEILKPGNLISKALKDCVFKILMDFIEGCIQSR